MLSLTDIITIILIGKLKIKNDVRYCRIFLHHTTNIIYLYFNDFQNLKYFSIFNFVIILDSKTFLNFKY